MGGRRRGGRRASLDKFMERSSVGLAAGAAAVIGTFTVTESKLVKRVVAACADLNALLHEASLVVVRQDSVAIGDRDDEDNIVKTAYFGPAGSHLYWDFTTSIRLNRGDSLGLIVENISGATGDEEAVLLVLFRDPA